MLKLILFIIVSLTLFPKSSHSADLIYDEVGTGLEIQKGSGVSLLIEELGPSATSIGLTEEHLTAKIEMQLRKNGIRLVKSLSVPEIYVNLGVMEAGAFSWYIHFQRNVVYEVGKKRYLAVSATTYSKSGFGRYNPNNVPADLHERITRDLVSEIDILSNKILSSTK